jgi:hypothetical protein
LNSIPQLLTGNPTSFRKKRGVKEIKVRPPTEEDERERREQDQQRANGPKNRTNPTIVRTRKGHNWREQNYQNKKSGFSIIFPNESKKAHYLENGES